MLNKKVHKAALIHGASFRQYQRLRVAKCIFFCLSSVVINVLEGFIIVCINYLHIWCSIVIFLCRCDNRKFIHNFYHMILVILVIKDQTCAVRGSSANSII